MNTTLDPIAPELLQTIASQAAARDLSVNDYLLQVLGLTNGKPEAPPVNGKPQASPAVERLKPIPVPDSKRELRWLKEHAREYAGQWVALDGNRLIAHGSDAKAVFAAADADGAYLPLVTQVEDPDRPFILF